MTSALTIIDQEQAQFGWVESRATNSISNFKSTTIEVEEQTNHEKHSDLIDIFICHLIFYVIFIYSLFLYLAIDLGVGSFLKNKITKLIKFDKKPVNTSFIPTQNSQ